MATRLTLGALSLSISSHLLASENSKVVKPVTLPPGFARLRLQFHQFIGKRHVRFRAKQTLSGHRQMTESDPEPTCAREISAVQIDGSSSNSRRTSAALATSPSTAMALPPFALMEATTRAAPSLLEE
jgi:hypothetical protein